MGTIDYEALARQVIDTVWSSEKPAMPHSGERFSCGEQRLLGYLYCREEAVSAGTLSRVLNISTARVAKLLGTLEEKGAVCREADPKDRRRIRVLLTPEGQRMVRAVHTHMVGHLARLFEALGEQDAREYIRLCGRVAELNQTMKLWSEPVSVQGRSQTGR